MNVVAHTSGDVSTHGGGERPPSTGLIPDALPEVQKPVLAENSQNKGVHQNALSHTTFKAVNKLKEDAHWYALRTTYGREKKAYDYLKGKNIEAFLPTLTSVKLIAGKRKTITESRIPNIFFAYGTETKLKIKYGYSLALNNIGVRIEFKGYRRKSSMFCPTADVKYFLLL